MMEMTEKTLRIFEKTKEVREIARLSRNVSIIKEERAKWHSN